MTAAKTKELLDQSQIVLNNAQARVHDTERELNELEIQQERHAAEKAHRVALFDRSQDFFAGHYVFDDTVDDDSVTTCKTTLRRFNRVYPGAPITIELCSPGGSIIAGFSLIDELTRLRKLGHHLTIRVQGQAASMAAIILQAADRREIGGNSYLMIHRAAFGAIGKAYEVEDELDFVKKIEARIVSILATRSGKPADTFKSVFDLRKDIWYDAEEAVKAGLADVVI